LAEYIWNRNGHSEEGLHYDIFSQEPEAAEKDVLEYIDDGLTVEKSGMLPAYGFAILADGEANGDKNMPTYSNTMRDFWLYFGRAAGHGHLDSLNLGIEAFGLNMAPDNGTPASKSINMVRYQWVESTIAHNTVTVGNTVQNVFGTSTLGQRAYYLGYPKHFDSSDGVVKLMDVESDAYKDIADIYRRTVVMINVGSDVSYGIDFFRVKGGGEHIYSFHSQSHEVETEGLKLDPQDETQGDYKLDDKGYVGSYAGADVPYMYDQNRQTAIQKLKYPGTSWLKDVRRAAASRNEIAGDKFTVDFKVTDYNRFLKDSDGLHLRMTMLNDDYDEVAVATGTKVDTPSAQKLKPFEYVLVKNKDDSLFTTVFEPYKNKRYLESINEVDISATADEDKLGSDDIARAVKVTRTDGRTDYVVYATNSDATYTVADGDFSFEFRGFVGVLSLEKEGGEVIYRYVNDGDILHTSVDENDSDGKYDYGAYTGVVASYTEVEPAVKPTFNKNFITIETRDTVDTDRIIGQYVYIDNEGRADSQQNAVYKIENATYDASGKKLTIDIGTVSTVRTFEDIYNIDAGYIYNIAKGQNAVIPLSNIENCGPEFAKVSDFSVSAGSSVSVSLAQYRMDDNGKSVTYEAVGGVDIPRGASIDSATGKLTWRPDDSQVGNHSFKIKIRDELGRETAVTFVVTVYGRTTEGSSSGETPEIPSAGVSGGGAAPDTGNSSDQTDVGNGGSDVPADDKVEDNENSPDASGETEIFRFTDLSNHAWAADAINTLAADGIIKGTSANTFSPAANISRADFALLLVRAFKLSSDNTENFADVSASDYFAAELAIARNSGIVNGIGDNKFAPRNHITRQDMMVIVYRALSSLPLEEKGDRRTAVDEVLSQYPDFTTVADYAKEAVSALIGAGLVNGKSGRIAPTDYTTRAEVAVLIKRILDYTKK
ncbi:MAG: S-layer homology domain-containing protein, partial [Oscillospiraceae bacterium]|nr:S-layer homology domain-containing protein [Oscillospiraceae bacterium]